MFTVLCHANITAYINTWFIWPLKNQSRFFQLTCNFHFPITHFFRHLAMMAGSQKRIILSIYQCTYETWTNLGTWHCHDSIVRYAIPSIYMHIPQLFCETQWPRPPLFSLSWLIQWSMGEGSYITLISPSDITAFHRIYKKMAFLYQSMMYVQTHWKHFFCVFLRANVTKYIDTQMSLFCCFLHNSKQLEWISYCDSYMHISLRNISTCKLIYKNRDHTMPWWSKIKVK